MIPDPPQPIPNFDPWPIHREGPEEEPRRHELHEHEEREHRRYDVPVYTSPFLAPVVPITGVAQIAMPAVPQILQPPPQYIVPVADPSAVVQPASAVYSPNIPGMGAVWDSPLLGDAPVAVLPVGAGARASATLPPYMSTDMPAYMPSMSVTSMSSAPFTSAIPDSPGSTQSPQDSQDSQDSQDAQDSTTDSPSYSYPPLVASSGRSGSRNVWLIIISVVMVAIALGLAYVYMRKRRGGGGSLMFL